MVKVRIITADEMVVILEASSIWEAIRVAREQGYQVAVAVEVT